MKLFYFFCLLTGAAGAIAIPISGESKKEEEPILENRAKSTKVVATTKTDVLTITKTAAQAATVTAAANSVTTIDPNFDVTAAQAAESSASTAAAALQTGRVQLMVAKLVQAATAAEKVDMLADSDFKFDFNTEAAGTNGQGGTIVTANLASFPVVQMTGSSMAIGEMAPCGFATPHSHPRANELNLVIKGNIVSAMTLENNVRVINQTLSERQMTVFPQGSMHMEINSGCSNATFVAAFTAADGGVQQSINVFTNFGDEVIQATMGGSLTVEGKDVDAFKKIIPVNMALGVESCLKACGIKKRSLEETMTVLRRGLPQRATAVESATSMRNLF